MKDQPAKPQHTQLLDAYAAAVMAFNSASAALIVHLVAQSLPTAKEVLAEEETRAAVVDRFAVNANLHLCVLDDAYNRVRC